MRKIWMGLVLASAAGLILYASFGRNGGADQSIGFAPSQHLPVPASNGEVLISQLTEVPASAGAPILVKQSPASAKLVAEFASATDWRAFALSARQRPEEGGYFYAMLVTNFCGMTAASSTKLSDEAVANAVAKTGTVSPATLKLTNQFSRRCASFVGNEASTLRSEVKAASSDKRDPLVNATLNLAESLKGSDSATLKTALKSLLSLNDPTAPYSELMLERIMKKSAQNVAAGGIWFDGMSYAPNDYDALSRIGLAMKLAPCGTATPCELDTTMMISCLGGYICADSRESYLRQIYVDKGGMTEVEFARANELGVRLRQVVANQEVDAFLP